MSHKNLMCQNNNASLLLAQTSEHSYAMLLYNHALLLIHSPQVTQFSQITQLSHISEEPEKTFNNRACHI